MNNVVLLGRLTKDPELRFAAGSGNAVCRFTVAVNRMKKGETDFINCLAFGKTGEVISEHMQKGSQIALEGRIQTGSYENKEGKKIYTTDVVLDRFEFVGGGQAKEVAPKNEFDDIEPNDVEEVELPW